MNYDEISRFVVAQRSRDPRPMNAFCQSMLGLANAATELQRSEMSPAGKSLLMHLTVVHLVTVMECYFRASVDAIVRLCKREAFLPALGRFAKQKYSVQDIVELEARGLHVLQVIPRELSFQSLEQIANVFDQFFPAGFVKVLGRRQFRFKDNPDYVMQVNSKELSELSALFEVRHEIVHNPSEASLLRASGLAESHVDAVWCFVFCANAAIEEFIGENLRSPT
jgi:hypothetical protein